VIVLMLSILGSVFSLGGNILIAHKKRSGCADLDIMGHNGGVLNNDM